MNVKRFVATTAAVSVLATGCASGETSSPSHLTAPSMKTEASTPPLAAEKFEGFSVGATLYELDADELAVRLDRIKKLGQGVNMLRLDIDWAQIQPEKSGRYQWEKTDRVIQAARLRGFTVLAMVGFAPEWARDPACTSDYSCAPKDPEAFAAFAGEAAKHLKDNINHWEIWNEPNTPHFLGEKTDAPRYAAMLTLAGNAIKHAQPHAKVASGGLAAGEDDGKSMKPVTFLKQLYQLSALGDDIDAIAVHPYSIPAKPSQAAEWNAFTQLGGEPGASEVPKADGDIKTVYDLLNAHGDLDTKEVWLTEYGAPTSGGDNEVTPANQQHFIDNGFESGHVTEGLQADMVRDFLTYEFQGMKVPMRVVYTDQDSANYGESPDTEQYFGVFRADGSRKPAADAFGN